VDVLQDGSRLPEMLKLSGGQRRVPVIVDGGKIEVGFDGHS
jgi:glutaredoxin